MKKILFVLTSHDKKGSTGEPTGFFLSEAAHPWEVLTTAGYTIDFVSPKGGEVPVDGFDLSDPINKKFWDTNESKLKKTLKPSEVDVENYIALYFAGGHGTMWDFAENKELAVLAQKLYESGGILGAICHGPSGLLNVKLSDGTYLVNGKKINSFTNEEEIAVKLEKVVPFMLETELKIRGALFEKSPPWNNHVCVDQRIVTGQNPQSATSLGHALVEEIKKIE